MSPVETKVAESACNNAAVCQEEEQELGLVFLTVRLQDVWTF